MSLDLVRLAVFFLILPLPAALSRALMVEATKVLASSLLATRAFLDFLVKSLILAAILSLMRTRFLLLRNSFLAEALLGIVIYYNKLRFDELYANMRLDFCKEIFPFLIRRGG